MKVSIYISGIILFGFLLSCSLFSNEKSKEKKEFAPSDLSTLRPAVEQKLSELDKLTDILITIADAKDKSKFEEKHRISMENVNKLRAELTKLIEEKDILPAENFLKRESELKKLIKENFEALDGNLIKWEAEKEKLIDERYYAIILLAKLGTKKAIQFLVDNITLDLEPRSISGDVDMAKEEICLVALIEKSDWRVIPYVLKVLEKPRTEKEIRYFWLVLIHVMDEDSGVKKLGHKRTKALIQSELEIFKDDKSKETYVDNLNQIKQYLENPDK